MPYKGLILECSFSDLKEINSPEVVLSSLELAPNLAVDSILSDPTGILKTVHQAVSQEYAHRKWVLARWEQGKERVINHLKELKATDSPSQAALALGPALMYSGGVIAASFLAPPTHRKSLIQMRKLLQTQGRLDLCEKALTLLGSAHLNREQVESFLQESAMAFDRAVEVYSTPHPFGFKFQKHVRPYFVEGAQEMVDEGYHREAMCWILGIHCIAFSVIQNDAPDEEKPKFYAKLDQLLQELGLGDADTWPCRKQQVLSFAEEIFEFTEDFIKRNPKIRN